MLEAKLADIEKVYPTKDPFDLFETFPEGFSLSKGGLRVVENGKSARYLVTLEGDSVTQKIRGKVYRNSGVREGNEKGEDPESSYEVEYLSGGKLVRIDGGEVDEAVKEVHFLFERYTLNRDKLSKMKVNYRYLRDNVFFLLYEVEDPILADYLDVPDDVVIYLDVEGDSGMISEGRYKTSIFVNSPGKEEVYERVISK